MINHVKGKAQFFEGVRLCLVCGVIAKRANLMKNVRAILRQDTKANEPIHLVEEVSARRLFILTDSFNNCPNTNSTQHRLFVIQSLKCFSVDSLNFLRKKVGIRERLATFCWAWIDIYARLILPLILTDLDEILIRALGSTER